MTHHSELLYSKLEWVLPWLMLHPATKFQGEILASRQTDKQTVQKRHLNVRGVEINWPNWSSLHPCDTLWEDNDGYGGLFSHIYLYIKHVVSLNGLTGMKMRWMISNGLYSDHNSHIRHCSLPSKSSPIDWCLLSMVSSGDFWQLVVAPTPCQENLYQFSLYIVTAILSSAALPPKCTRGWWLRCRCIGGVLRKKGLTLCLLCLYVCVYFAFLDPSCCHHAAELPQCKDACDQVRNESHVSIRSLNKAFLHVLFRVGTWFSTVCLFKFLKPWIICWVLHHESFYSASAMNYPV